MCCMRLAENTGCKNYAKITIWVLRLRFVTGPTSLSGGQPNFAGCLAISWSATLYIHFGEAFAPNGILQVQNLLCPSLVLSYICSITAWHSRSSVFQANFAAWYLRVTGWPSRSTLGGQTV